MGNFLDYNEAMKLSWIKRKKKATVVLFFWLHLKNGKISVKQLNYNKSIILY
jgi:hypothetical protein